MKWVVNALSVTNLSGRHVLSSYLRALAPLLREDMEILVLNHKGNRDLCDASMAGFRFRECPSLTRNWIGRTAWERTHLESLLIREGAGGLVMTSGYSLPRMPVPQVVVAMNPWCFVPAAWEGWRDRLKAALQRQAYRRTVREAAGMVYLSGYLRDAYHGLAGQSARRHAVVYASLPPDVWAAAGGAEPRMPGRILCVSAMAPHKGCETLIDAVAEVKAIGHSVSLMLVGGWPDARYRRAIEKRILARGMEHVVTVTGHLARADLLREYARASVFAILSQCESFGIPGLEAQAFGTPMVCSAAGAMPEVYGQGAVVVPVDDSGAAAEALERVLGNGVERSRLSSLAGANAERFREADVGRRLLSLLDTVVTDHQRQSSPGTGLQSR